MKRVLLVWEEIPESTKIYLLDLDGEALAKTLRAHGQIVNSTDNHDEALWLCEFLVGKQVSGEHAAVYVGDMRIDYIVKSGFFL